MKIQEYERLMVKVSDDYLYGIFGIEDYEPMVITRDSIDCLEDYLLDYDEDDEPKMNETEVQELFSYIKNKLEKYKEVQVIK